MVLSLSLLIAVTVGGWTVPASAAEEKGIDYYAQFNMNNADTNLNSKNAVTGINDLIAFDTEKGAYKFGSMGARCDFHVTPDGEHQLSSESITVTIEYFLPTLTNEENYGDSKFCFWWNNGNDLFLRAKGGNGAVNGVGDDLVRGEWAIYSVVLTGVWAAKAACGGEIIMLFWEADNGNPSNGEDVIWIKSVTLCSTEDITKSLNQTGADEFVSFNVTHPLYSDYTDYTFVATSNMTWAMGEGQGELTNDGVSMPMTTNDMVYFRPTKSLHEENVAVRCVFKEETGYAAVQYNVPEDPDKPGHIDEQYKRVDGTFSSHELWFDLSDADFRSAQNNQASFRVCFPGLTLQRVEVYVLKNNSGYTATLKEDISLNFKVGSPLFTKNAANTDVAVTVGDNTTTTKLNEYTFTDGQYTVPVPVAAKNMGDKITVTVKNTENNVDMSFTKSVKEYAESILASETEDDVNAQPLVKAMLNYGAAAQEYFDYKTDAPVNDGCVTDLSSVTADSLSDYNKHNKSQSVNDVIFIGANLSLKSKTTLRLYFKADATFTASVNGQSLTVMKEEATGRSYVEVNNITPDKLADDITVTVTSGTVTDDVTYNVMSYCYNVLKLEPSKYADLQNAIRALCMYNTAAADYVQA